VRNTTTVTLASSVAFAAIGAGVAWSFGFGPTESLLIGGAMCFSSTIIGLKLLPTTVLHHQRTGEIMISILLLQDLIAIVILLLLRAAVSGEMPMLEVARLLLGPPLLVLAAWALERYLYFPLIRKFDKIREYLFLMAIGWCLGMAELGVALGLSPRSAPSSAGSRSRPAPSRSTSPRASSRCATSSSCCSFSRSGGLQSRQAGRHLSAGDHHRGRHAGAEADRVPAPAGAHRGEPARSREIGFRLGQLSEFSLLIAVLAATNGVIGADASYLIQLATMLTFLASSYIVVLRFPTPIAVSDKLRRD